MKIRLERGESMKQIKRKSGFTLIELLAVIIILGIIALIVVPTVKDVMDESKKKAFMNTAYGIVEAGELYHTKKDMLDEELVEETILFPNGADKLKIKGKLPKEGSMIIDEDGNIAMAISDGKYCITKNFGSEDVTITETSEKCELQIYNVGDVVYYNPNEDEICTETDYNNNADKNGNSGCMRWYVYALNGSNPKLILDHNTTNKVVWNEEISAGGGIPQSSQSEQKYVPNTLINKTNDSVEKTTPQTMADSIEATTLIEQLAEDTTDWKVKADIITLEELLNLLPYYQKLSPSEKQAFLNPTEENISVIYGYFDASDAAYNDEDMPSGVYTVELAKAQNEYLAENYPDLVLPKYMYEDLIGTCENVGNGGVQCGTWGYWTQTALDSVAAWDVYNNGYVGTDAVDNGDNVGLRPVITLSK